MLTKGAIGNLVNRYNAVLKMPSNEYVRIVGNCVYDNHRSSNNLSGRKLHHQQKYKLGRLYVRKL